MKVEEKKANNGTSIYEKVYLLLLAMGEEKIRPYKLYYLVENMKINNEEILNIIRGALSGAGFSETNIDRIANNLSWKLRFTLKDAKAIEKELCKQNLISREKNYIVVKQGATCQY